MRSREYLKEVFNTVTMNSDIFHIILFRHCVTQRVS